MHSFSTILFALNENKEPKNSNKSKFSWLQQKANVFYAFLWQVCQERVKKGMPGNYVENGKWNMNCNQWIHEMQAFSACILYF